MEQARTGIRGEKMIYKHYLLASAVTALLASGPVFGLAVTPTGDGNQLAASILGSGVTINSVSYNASGTAAAGGFTGGLASGLGFDEGIIITTGDASSAPGPNLSDSTGAILGLPGSAALDALTTVPTFDAVILEITFTTLSGNLFFDFVFASEEYNEFVDAGFNDVFGFFLDGLAVSDNIAIAPDGMPVAIDNVNCGNPFSGSGPNCSIFNNNDLDDGGPFFDLEYDGFTDTLTAMALGLDAGEHTLTIAIADAGDAVYDSAVFIKGGSFSGVVPVPAAAWLMLSAMALLGALRRRRG